MFVGWFPQLRGGCVGSGNLTFPTAVNSTTVLPYGLSVWGVNVSSTTTGTNTTTFTAKLLINSTQVATTTWRYIIFLFFTFSLPSPVRLLHFFSFSCFSCTYGSTTFTAFIHVGAQKNIVNLQPAFANFSNVRFYLSAPALLNARVGVETVEYVSSRNTDFTYKSGLMILVLVVLVAVVVGIFVHMYFAARKLT